MLRSASCPATLAEPIAVRSTPASVAGWVKDHHGACGGWPKPWPGRRVIGEHAMQVAGSCLDVGVQLLPLIPAAQEARLS